MASSPAECWFQSTITLPKPGSCFSPWNGQCCCPHSLPSSLWAKLDVCSSDGLEEMSLLPALCMWVVPIFHSLQSGPLPQSHHQTSLHSLPGTDWPHFRTFTALSSGHLPHSSHHIISMHVPSLELYLVPYLHLYPPTVLPTSITTTITSTRYKVHLMNAWDASHSYTLSHLIHI